MDNPVPFTLDWISDLHAEITDGTLMNPMYPGMLRVTNVVKITGTNYIPPVWKNFKDEQNTFAELVKQSQQFSDKTKQILFIYIYMCKLQFFIDGNKRTALLSIDSLLLKNNLGLLVIPTGRSYNVYMDKMKQFYEGSLSANKMISYLKQYYVKTS